MVVRRIEDLGDRFGHGVLLECADIVAAREGVHVEALRHAGTPERELVDGRRVIAGDVQIVRHGDDGLIAGLGRLELVAVHPLVHLSAEANLYSIVLAGMQPHIAHFEPVVRELHLPAVYDLLTEDAKFIADGETGYRIIQAGRRIHIAGGQTAQTAVAKSGIRFKRAEAFQAEAEIMQDLPCRFQQAHVVQVVAQARADQKFHRHIIDLLALLCTRLLNKRTAVVLQKLAHGDAYSAIYLFFRRHFERAAEQPVAAFL